MISKTINTLSLLFCLLISGSMFAAVTPAPVEGIADQLITLRAGTTVSVTLNEELYLEDLNPGHAIDFMVRSNVTVNGKVVIAAGAIAEGVVKSIKIGCKGQCGSVSITVENVQAVDGQRINLRSTPHVIRVYAQGYNKETVDIGTNLSAKVLNDVKINA